MAVSVLPTSQPPISTLTSLRTRQGGETHLVAYFSELVRAQHGTIR